MDNYIALLRGINVGGHRRVPMADLRDTATSLGHANVKTHLASGNLMFQANGDAKELEAGLEAAVEKTFGFPVDIIVISLEDWKACLDGNPFVPESDATPNFVMLCVGKEPAGETQLETLKARADADERVKIVDGVIWLYYANGAGRSKMMLKPKEGVWTSRNWRTAQKLAEYSP